MKDLLLRFAHLMEQILQKLDNKSLVKSREVSRIWQTFIDQINYPWVRIVKIPTILNRGNTYLHLAAKHGQIDMFEVILNGEADKNLVNDFGYTPFFVACRYGQMRIAELIMKKSTDLKSDLSRKDIGGETVLHKACSSGNSDSNSVLVEMLMKISKKLKIEINILNNANHIALHLASNHGHAETAKVLMEESTTLKFDLNVQNKQGYTAFHFACQSGSTDIVRIMLDQSESTKLDFSLKTMRGDTGFHLACQFEQANIVELLIEKSKSLKLDLKSKNKWGATGFQLVSDQNIIDLIKSKMPSLAQKRRKHRKDTARNFGVPGQNGIWT